MATTKAIQLATGVLPELTLTGDLSFNDNDKAIFGASSDLQIYHDGSNSYIKESGTGDLKILANRFIIRNVLDTDSNIECDPSGAVRIYHGGNQMFTTATTGISVAGDIDAEGTLSLYGSGKDLINIRASDNTLDRGIAFQNSGLYYTGYISVQDAGSNVSSIVFGNSPSAAASIDDVTKRMSIDPNGDISFFEDTGTTPKFFWDASAERLGIGTSSPFSALHLSRANSAPATSGNMADNGLTISNGIGGRAIQIGVDDASARSYIQTGYVNNCNVANHLSFLSGANESMRIDSSGRVGIGTSDPDASLEINSTTTQLKLEYTNTSAATIYVNSGGDFVTERAGNVPFVWRSGGSEKVRIDSSGNIGIGTSSPYSKTEIVSTNAGGESELLQIRNNSTNAGTTSVLRFVNSIDPSSYQNGGFIKSIRNNVGDNDLTFGTVDNERMRIDNTGNVGIGTDSPDSLLSVALSGGTGTYFEGGGTSNQANLRRLLITASTTSATGDTHTLNAESVSGNIAFATANSERMRIDSSGRVGIGTSTINNRLVVESTSAEEGITIRGNGFDALKIGMVNPGVSNDGIINVPITNALRFATNNTERMRIAADGKVGIGTTSPSAQLDIESASDCGLEVISGTTNTSTLYMGDTSVRYSGYIQYNNSNNSMVFASNTLERMRIDSSGNVGIGTDNPQYPLHIDSNGVNIGALTLGDQDTSSNDTGIYLRTNSLAKFSTAPSGGFVFYTDGLGTGEKVRITNGGNVGIGTSNPYPYHKLHVNGVTYSAMLATNIYGVIGHNLYYEDSAWRYVADGHGYGWNQTGTNGSDFILNYAPHNTGAAGAAAAYTSERMRITSSGSVGIGTSSPIGKLTVDGDVYIGDPTAGAAKITGVSNSVTFGDLYSNYLQFDNSTEAIRGFMYNQEVMRVDYLGNAHFDGDVIAYSTTISDERLKENIVGIDGALDKVSQLNGYTFTYKTDGKVSAGVIAQEVEKVLPEAVSEKDLPLKVDDGEQYKVVNYDALHGLLIEAVKELTAKVADLEAKLEAK